MTETTSSLFPSPSVSFVLKKGAIAICLLASGWAQALAPGAAPEIVDKALSAAQPFGSACGEPPAGPWRWVDVMQQALCGHPLTQEAHARWQQSLAAQALSKSSAAVQTQAQLSAQAQHQARPAPRSDVANQTAQVHLRASHLLADGGYQKAWAQALASQSRAAGLELDMQIQRVLYEASETFWQQANIESQLRVAQQHLARARDAVRVVAAKRKEGLAIGLDEQQARLQQLQAQASVDHLQGQRVAASVALRTLLRLPLSSEPLALELPSLECSSAQADPFFSGLASLIRRDDLGAEAGKDEPSLNPETLDQLVAHSLRELQAHPQRAAAVARLQTALEQRNAATRQGRYSLSWSAVAAQSHQAATGAPSAGSLGQVSLGLTLDIPLGDGGARQARIAQALASEDLARAQLEQSERQLNLQVWQASAQWLSALQQCQTQQAAYEVSRKSSEQAKARYAAGVGTVLEWMTLQTQADQAQHRWTQARGEVWLGQLRLRRSLGQLHPAHLGVLFSAPARGMP